MIYLRVMAYPDGSANSVTLAVRDEPYIEGRYFHATSVAEWRATGHAHPEFSGYLECAVADCDYNVTYFGMHVSRIEIEEHSLDAVLELFREAWDPRFDWDEWIIEMRRVMARRVD